mmetsp:Transcript_105195/g.339310  ORF Transcript_105195/g.339310 Transcript_105195/m.339310 type:complete len:931 (-) Transcript_105195:76-2868(-)
MTASQAPGTAARPAGGPPGGRGPGEGGHCVRLPTLATRDLESKKLAADIYDESFLEGFTHGYDASLRGRTKGSCAGCTLKSLAQSYTRQSTHVDFFEQLYGSSGDLTRRDRGSPRQEGPHSARRPRQPTLPKSPRRSATMQLEKQEDEPATPGAASSAKGSRPRLSSSAPSTPKASARRPSASERALEAGPQSTQTLRQREACESLRMLVFGHVGNEDWLVQDRHKIFEQQRGTEAEIDTFVEQWLLLDDDDSGTIDFNEFLDFFAKKKADKLLGMRCVRYLVGSRLLWLRATDADVAAMEAALRRLVQQQEVYRPEAPWDQQQSWVFHHGSNIDPVDVWGAAATNSSLPVLQPDGALDARVLPLVARSHAAPAALAAELSRPSTHHRLVCTALIELAAASRAADPKRSLRLAHCAAARICWQGRAGQDGAARAGGMDTDLKLLLAEAVAEFSLSCLALRGAASRELTADLIGAAVDLGQRSDPMRVQHQRMLRLAAHHALAFERDPCKSERLQKRCLELKLQKYNTWQHPEIAETLGDCGVLCHVLGDLAHAESMLRTAAGVWRQLLDRAEPKLAAAWVDLADLLVARERWSEAEELYQQSAGVLREASDGSQQLYAVLNRLALFHRQRGKPEAALPVLRECVTGVQQVLAPGDHLVTAALQHNLAQCLMAVHGETAERTTSNVEEAWKLLEQVREAYSASLPASNPSVLAMQCSVARCQLLLRRPDAAVAALEKALRLMEELGSSGAQELGKVHFLLGRARLLQGREAESRRHFEWVLRHPAVADALPESDRMAAEEFVGRPSEKPGQEKGPPRPPSPPALGPPELEGGEPQGEPEAWGPGPGAQGKGVGDGRHLGFPDVEVASLSVLNRVQYLMGERVKACLGALPPLEDGHVGHGGAPCGPALPGDDEAGGFAGLLSRMELVCSGG